MFVIIPPDKGQGRRGRGHHQGDPRIVLLLIGASLLVIGIVLLALG
jgi:hypothetical protein